jgi:hypothetical protein
LLAHLFEFLWHYFRYLRHIQGTFKSI